MLGDAVMIALWKSNVSERWRILRMNGGLLLGRSAINGGNPIAMFEYQRVSLSSHTFLYYLYPSFRVYKFEPSHY